MRRPAWLLALAVASCGGSPDAPVERVTIPAGASVAQVAESLSAHGIIGPRRWFRLMARLGGYERKLQIGTYELRRGSGARAALRAIAGGRAILTRFTVPEGFTLLEIAASAERDLKIPREEFLAATRDTALLREFEIPAPTMEGFLRPETYLFAAGVSATQLVRTMAETFREDWNGGWSQAAQAEGLDRLALVTLASIVEGEAAVDEDRALIAAVYRNRVRLGMPLQADPTVQYALQQATGARKPRLFERDYGFQSPYNTYLHPGLPPGPVGAPSRKSIEATLAPAPVPFLYFVAGPGGKHIFSRTYAEHLRAVRRVQRGR